MIRNILTATASALVLVACATTEVPAEAPAPVTPAAPASAAIPPIPDVPTSAIGLAMGTVDTLVASGNTQTAIDRLTQVLGTPDLSDDDKAAILSRRADLRASPQGYDLMGAISDYAQVMDAYPTSPAAADAPTKLVAANGQAAALNALLKRPETPRLQRFESHFNLGQHEEALDLMLSSGLKPGNEHLIAMYQIGYLCSGDEQTGPAYNATEPDGTPRELRFCDFGK